MVMAVSRVGAAARLGESGGEEADAGVGDDLDAGALLKGGKHGGDAADAVSHTGAAPRALRMV